MFPWIAERLLWINLMWYSILTIAFLLAGAYPKALYFFGAFILTCGVVLM